MDGGCKDFRAELRFAADDTIHPEANIAWWERESSGTARAQQQRRRRRRTKELGRAGPPVRHPDTNSVMIGAAAHGSGGQEGVGGKLVLEGWLATKKGAQHWQMQHCVLDAGEGWLKWYTDDNNQRETARLSRTATLKEAAGTSGIAVADILPASIQDHFDTTSSSMSTHAHREFQFMHCGEVYLCRAKNEDSRDEWVALLSSAVKHTRIAARVACGHGRFPSDPASQAALATEMLSMQGLSTPRELARVRAHLTGRDNEQSRTAAANTHHQVRQTPLPRAFCSAGLADGGGILASVLPVRSCS